MLKRVFVSCVLVAITALVLCATANAAVISWSSDVFDADADISTTGILVTAINEGTSAPAVVVNGVTFAANPGTNSFFVNGGDASGSGYYTGSAIGSLTNTETQDLLDTLAYGPGPGNSLARLSVTSGQQYELQVLLVDHLRAASHTIAPGYATPSGDATEVYSDGVSFAVSPYVLTGTFTANEANQDVHIAIGGGSSAANGQVQAWQLRAVPEPSSVCLMALGLLCMIGFGWRRRANK